MSFIVGMRLSSPNISLNSSIHFFWYSGCCANKNRQNAVAAPTESCPASINVQASFTISSSVKCGLFFDISSMKSKRHLRFGISPRSSALRRMFIIWNENCNLRHFDLIKSYLNFLRLNTSRACCKANNENESHMSTLWILLTSQFTFLVKLSKLRFWLNSADAVSVSL